jgi:hypothetical protein
MGELPIDPFFAPRQPFHYFAIGGDHATRKMMIARTSTTTAKISAIVILDHSHSRM